MVAVKGMATIKQTSTLRKGSTDKSGRDAHTVLSSNPVHRFRNGVYPRSLMRIQGGKTGLNRLENLFLWVQLRQRRCVWRKGGH